MATGSKNGTCQIWNVLAGHEVCRFELDTKRETLFTPDGPFETTWNVSVTSVAFSPDGKHLLSGHSDATARLSDCSNGKEIRRFEGNSDPVTSLALSADGQQLIVGTGRPRLWSLATGRQTRCFKAHRVAVDSVAFSPDGRKALTGSQDGIAILWDIATGEEIRRYQGSAGYFNHVSYSSDGQHVTTQSSNATVLLWDAITGELLRKFCADPPLPVESVTFSPDGRYVLTGERGRIARLWDTVTGKEVRRFEGHADDVKCVAFSHGGQLVATASDAIVLPAVGDNTARLWDTATGMEVRRLEGHTGGINSVVFSRDDGLVLTGSVDRTARLWDVATGEQLRIFDGHLGAVTCVVFFPDGRRVLTGSVDGTVRIWDSATGDELARLTQLRGDDASLIVTPEGLFDGQRGASEKVAFRIGEGLTVVPVDRFFQDFYRPGLLAEIWQGKRPIPGKRLGSTPAPEVQLLLSGQQTGRITIDAVVTDRGGGIKEPWLFHNQAKGPKAENVVKNGTSLRCQFTASLEPGENRIQVHSASADGSWESEPAVLTLDYDGSLPAPELYVLIVAIDKYQDPGDLVGCVAGGKAMAEMLRRSRAGQYANVHVTTVFDEDATREKITAAIDAIASKAQSQDTLLVFVTAHGCTLGQRYYVLPHEYRPLTESEAAESGGNPYVESIRQRGLPIDELGSHVAAVRALKRVLIFDTCQSGSAVQWERSPFEFRGAVERFARSQGIFTLASSAEDANAFEHPMTGDMGILTFTLLAGMGVVEDKHNLLDGARIQSGNPNGEVDVLDWFRFAEKHVPGLVEQLESQKNYHIEMRGREPDFPLLSLETD